MLVGNAKSSSGRFGAYYAEAPGATQPEGGTGAGLRKNRNLSPLHRDRAAVSAGF